MKQCQRELDDALDALYLERVDARREDEEDWCGRAGLFKGLGELHGTGLDVLGSQFLLDKALDGVCHPGKTILFFIAAFIM